MNISGREHILLEYIELRSLSSELEKAAHRDPFVEGTTAPVVVMSAIFVLRPLSEFQAHLDKSTNYLGPLERRGLSVGLEKVRIIERGRMWSALAVTCD